MYHYSTVTDPEVSRELRKIEEAFGEPSEFVYVRETHAALARPRQGMIIYADGTDYDPGYGEGLYLYDGTSWLRLVIGLSVQGQSFQADVLTAAPSSPTDGMLVYADGTTWNPGSGRGFYEYNAGWVKL